MMKVKTTTGTALLLIATLHLEPATPVREAAPQRPAASPAGAPERPRQVVDVSEPRRARRTIHVKDGGDLQAALHDARGGDRITLAAGATYRGPFRLPRKDGTEWIVIASESEAGLPPPGRRTDPSHAARMPKLVAASGDAVVVTDAGAHHYRFVGLEMAPSPGVFLHAIAELGNDETDVDAQPHHLVFDRCYLHGDRIRGTRRGVAMNARHAAVINSYLSDFKEVGADSQAIGSWNGAGPFKIANNYLEAAGENVMFGGADPKIPNLVPSDIEIVDNHFSKPLRWKTGEDTLEGTPWTVKNLFELKNARRVTVSGNLFEHNWPHGQNGFAILFTVRNQDGGAPWSVVEDVTFENNLVRHVAAGFNILGQDDNQTSQQTKRIAIRNNLFVDVGGEWGGGRLFQLLDGTSGVTIDHNTALQTGGIVFGGDGAPHTGFVFQNNVVRDNGDAIIGSSAAPGIQSLQRYFPDAVVRRNVVMGGTPGHYPVDNFFPMSLEEVGFGGELRRNPRLTLARQYVGKGTDGRDPGADVAVITRLTNGIRSALSRDCDVTGNCPALVMAPRRTARVHLHRLSDRHASPSGAPPEAGTPRSNSPYGLHRGRRAQ